MGKVDPNKQNKAAPRIQQADLEADVIVVTIAKYEERQFRDKDGTETRASLYFEEYGDKPLRLNKTQTEYLVDALGDDDDQWVGKEIPIERTVKEFGGKNHPTVWVVPPEQWDDVLGQVGVASPVKRTPRAVATAKRKKARPAKGKARRPETRSALRR